MELRSPVVVVVEAAVVTVVAIVAVVTVVAVIAIVTVVTVVAVIAIVTVIAVVTMVTMVAAVVAAMVVMGSGHHRGRRGDGRRNGTSQGQGETRKGSDEPFDVAHDISPEMH
ncbi:hypothetical protein [Streptomyces sp. NPDC054834]